MLEEGEVVEELGGLALPKAPDLLTFLQRQSFGKYL
jgi:hypothetical protein